MPFGAGSKTRLTIVVALGGVYAWLAPSFLAPRRHESATLPAFAVLHLLTLIAAIIYVARARNRKWTDIWASGLILVVWVYTFFFIMLNSFGS